MQIIHKFLIFFLIGWFNGCGEFLCTGRENILLIDFTGSFLGKPSSVISMNELIGDKLDFCKANTIWNGFECDTTNFAILEFLDISRDR